MYVQLSTFKFAVIVNSICKHGIHRMPSSQKFVTCRRFALFLSGGDPLCIYSIESYFAGNPNWIPGHQLKISSQISYQSNFVQDSRFSEFIKLSFHEYQIFPKPKLWFVDPLSPFLQLSWCFLWSTFRVNSKSFSVPFKLRWSKLYLKTW